MVKLFIADDLLLQVSQGQTQLSNDEGGPVDGTNALELSAAEIEGRRQILNFFRFLRAYAPGFGGNCPVALAEGERRPGQPELFVVIGKTLYLTSSPAARRRLTEDPGSVLKRASAQWKRLRN